MKTKSDYLPWGMSPIAENYKYFSFKMKVFFVLSFGSANLSQRFHTCRDLADGSFQIIFTCSEAEPEERSPGHAVCDAGNGTYFALP